MDGFDGFPGGLHDAGGTTLFARIGGNPDGPPLLLLHGYPQTHAMWRRVALKLAPTFCIVLADLRGYGDSAKPAPAATPELDHAQYSKRAMAADMAALMRSLGHERFAVVGRLYDPVALWRAQCSATVTGHTLDAGHFLAEELPDATAALLSDHLVH